MIISEFPTDPEGIIHTKNVIRILSIGVKKGVPTIWAITDSLGKRGIPASRFIVKKVGSHLEDQDVTLYVSTLHERETNESYFIFGEAPKFDTGAPMPPPPGGLDL